MRDELNRTAPRRLAVLEPLELNIVNFNTLGLKSVVQVANHPMDASMGKREVAFSAKLFIGKFIWSHSYKITKHNRTRRFRGARRQGLPSADDNTARRLKVWRGGG